MPKLSPDAQAVSRDLAEIMQELGKYCRVSISARDVVPITLETTDASLQAGINALCAAALRAAADQVVQHMHAPDWSSSTYEVAAKEMYLQNQRIRSRLLAIAAELENLSE